VAAATKAVAGSSSKVAHVAFGEDLRQLMLELLFLMPPSPGQDEAAASTTTLGKCCWQCTQKKSAPQKYDNILITFKFIIIYQLSNYHWKQSP